VVGEPASVRASARGELEVKCGSCGVVTRMGAEQIAPPPSPLAPGEPATTCPKCKHRQRNHESCDRCGLVFERWDPDRARAPTDEAAEALWGSVDRAWDDDACHRAFTEYCSLMGLYAYAAQQYGGAREIDGRRERAVSEIARLTAIAQSVLAATQPKTSAATVRRIKTTMLVVAFVVCAALLAIVASRFL
jgi:hypothetical protein